MTNAKNRLTTYEKMLDEREWCFYKNAECRKEKSSGKKSGKNFKLIERYE